MIEPTEAMPWWERAIRDLETDHGPSGGAWNISMVLDRLRRAAQTDAVEAVARAIYEAKHKGLKNCYEWDDCRLDDEHPGAREGYERDARAALAAMPATKEPSQ